jgi:hypothetical protein
MSEVITPHDNGSGNDKKIPGMETERRMAALLNRFEDGDKNVTKHSDFLMFAHVFDGYVNTGGTMEEFAANPDLTIKEIVDSQYPEIEERELLAGALEKKYLDPESYFQKDLCMQESHDKNREDSGRGRPPLKLITSQYMDVGARRIVSFLTHYNDFAITRVEKKPTMTEVEDMRILREKYERDMQIYQDEIIEEFSSKILVKKTSSDSGMVTLRAWAEEISEHKFKDDISHEAGLEHDSATDSYRQVFNRVFSPAQRQIIIDGTKDHELQLYKDWSEIHIISTSHEPTKEMIERERTIKAEHKKANLLLRFLRFITDQGD